MHMTEEERQYYERTRKPLIPAPKTPLGKLFFAIALVLWFIVILLPCGFFYFATVGEVTFHHANIPQPDAHPLFRIQLIMDIDNRGLQFTRSFILPEADEQICVQTHVNYFFWQTNQQDSTATFCDCYALTTTERISTTMQPC